MPGRWSRCTRRRAWRSRRGRGTRGSGGCAWRNSTLAAAIPRAARVGSGRDARLAPDPEEGPHHLGLRGDLTWVADRVRLDRKCAPVAEHDPQRVRGVAVAIGAADDVHRVDV